nr:bifunctional diguanylate cyclase/phosphodiesterase [Lysinibacillus timonensis]
MGNTQLQILNQAFNQMTDISILFQVMDGRFTILKANQAAYRAGLTSEHYGNFIEDVLSPELSKTLNNLLNRAYTSKNPVRFNETLSSKDGKILGDIVLTPILDENGNCTHILGIGRDISESKRREEELLEVKFFYDTILSSTTDGILVTDHDRIIIRVNNAFTSLFGWEPEEIIGIPLKQLNLVPTEYEEEHEEVTKLLLQGRNIPFHRTYRKHKDGSSVPVSISYSPLKEQNGTVIGAIIIYRDISTVIDFEQQLEEEKQRYQSLFEHHPDAVFQFDLDGNFTDANHALEKITGYPKEELINKSFAPLVVESKISNTLENFLAAAAGQTRRYETEAIQKKGEHVFIDVTNIPIIVNGQVTGVYGISRNITEQKKLEIELRQIKETLQSFINNTLDAFNIVDLNKLVTDINPAFELIYGYSKEEILGQNITILNPDDSNDDDLYQKVLTGEKVHDIEVVHRHKDGTLIDVSLSLSPIRNEQGEITSIATISRNISEKKEDQRKLKESEEKYRLIAENMTDMIAIFDRNLVVLYASPSHKTVLGYDLEEGKPLVTERIFKDNGSVVFEKFNEVVESKTHGRIEFQVRHGEGHFIWLDTKLTPIFDNNGQLLHVLSVSRDISERKKDEAELEKMAFYDYLTGAANRRLFMDRLEQTISLAKKNEEHFSIMMLDFDRFKWVNDNFGHNVGDELLVQFVLRLKSCIRDVDTIARLGGDEFAILIPGISSVEYVEEMARKILEVLQHPWHIFGHEFITTSSIGICMSSCCGYDSHSIMKHADQALYKAKQTGRNNYQICNQTNEQFIEDDSEETFKHDIKRAIENNEFYLVFQPKFDLSSKEIVSIEALIRWEHPDKGLIVPDKFIPRAEEMDLIQPITKWVLAQAGKEAKKWQTLYDKEIPVSINISPKHLEAGTIMEDVEELIKKTSIDPHNIILEITENAMIAEMECTLKAIQRLKRMGLRIAIDDFGTGYSSLSYLMKLEVDILKLDKAFVQELTSKKNASLVFSIVSLAHNLNLDVVAEGIETEEQCHVLNQYGCDYGQGYYFSKPLIADQLEKVFLQKDIFE